MRLRAEQLESHLKQHLAPLYLLFGDEPLLVQEAADSVRARARAAGHDERQCLTVEPGFDWSQLLESVGTGSLFASHRLLELRLQEAKPGDQGARRLREYAAAPPSDTLLLITAGRLDPAAQNSAWFKALDQIGVCMQIWPVDARRLPAWIEQRMRARGLRPQREAVQQLAERTEGNLLAAAQEIDRLAVLQGEGPVSVATLDSVADSARYNVFDLVDSALAAKPARVSRVLRILEAEGVDPVLCCWALHRELRLLTELSQAARPEALFTRLGVRERRKPLVSAALKRLTRQDCQTLLAACARLDRLIKGAEHGGIPWEEMLHLAIQLAGVKLPATSVQE